MVRLRWSAVVLLCVSLAPPALWAADEPTDEQILAARSLLTDAAGRPLSPDRVTTDFLIKLYNLPNALGAMRKVLRQDAFAQLNARIGEVRHRAAVEIWSQIVRELGIDIELNNAGKKNGALSDLDNFLFTSALSIPGEREMTTPQMYAWLQKRFDELWRARFGGLQPKAFDVMHFPGWGYPLDQGRPNR